MLQESNSSNVQNQVVGVRHTLTAKFAYWAFGLSILPLLITTFWLIDDTKKTSGGCFTGDGLVEILILGSSYVIFSLAALTLALKARIVWLAIAAFCGLLPIFGIVLIFVWSP